MILPPPHALPPPPPCFDTFFVVVLHPDPPLPRPIPVLRVRHYWYLSPCQRLGRVLSPVPFPVSVILPLAPHPAAARLVFRRRALPQTRTSESCRARAPAGMTCMHHRRLDMHHVVTCGTGSTRRRCLSVPSRSVMVCSVLFVFRSRRGGVCARSDELGSRPSIQSCKYYVAS